MASATAKKLKKRKNAPDKPMPEGLFPDDHKNPVLNPIENSEQQILKQKKDWDEAVDFLQHISASAPLKPPPPALLLTLVGAFLTSYGFNGASHLYTAQLSSWKKLDDWKVELGVKLPKGFPDLVKIFQDWHKEYQELDETSSEDDDDNAPEPKSIKKEKRNTEKKAAVAQENSSSSSGSSGSNSDESEADVKSDIASPAPEPVKRESNSASSFSSSSTSSSDSDAHDEEEVIQKPRSASSSSSSDEVSSSSDSDSSPSAATVSKADRIVDKQVPLQKSLKDASKGTKEVSKEAVKTVRASKPPNLSNLSSISSTTLEINSPLKPAKATASSTSPSTSSTSSSASSSSSSESPDQPHSAGVPLISSKRKRSASPPVLEPATKKPRTPFQRVPKDTKVDSRLASNAYVSHEYGDRAHQDLSVTRGKGFTKEKNKKKRGSYRGGVIDVGGGKGIKFED